VTRNTSLVGEHCPACGSQLYGIKGKELARLVGIVHPTLKSPSLPDRIRNGRSNIDPGAMYVVCPQCDGYALGAETYLDAQLIRADGVPVHLRDLAPWSN
jgi:hypothetical protein